MRTCRRQVREEQVATGQARQAHSPLVHLAQDLEVHSERGHAAYSPITHRVRIQAGTMTSRAWTRDRAARQAVHQERNRATKAASVLEPIHSGGIGSRRDGWILTLALTTTVHQFDWQVICKASRTTLDIPSAFSRICRVSFGEGPLQH